MNYKVTKKAKTLAMFLTIISMCVPALPTYAADGYCKGIKLCGKVKVVERFADLKVKVVDHFPDLKVKRVQHFPGVK